MYIMEVIGGRRIMNKIEFFELRRGTDNKPEAHIETGMPIVLFSEDKSMKLMMVCWHSAKDWYCTEIYTGLLLTNGKTKAELSEHISQTAGRIFESETAGRIFESDWHNKYWNQAHQLIADAYKKLDEARPSGLFGRHSLSQELIEYITAPTFREAIHGGEEE